jgi:hypothetical protein
MRNRWYDPGTGRFTQEDPIGFAGGINLYAYAGNDPVTYSDPFGLCPLPWECEDTKKIIEGKKPSDLEESLETPLLDPVAVGTGAVVRAPASGAASPLVGRAEKATVRALNSTAGQFAFGFAQGFAKGIAPAGEKQNVEALKVIVPGVKAMQWGYKAGNAVGAFVNNLDKIRDIVSNTL